MLIYMVANMKEGDKVVVDLDGDMRHDLSYITYYGIRREQVRSPRQDKRSKMDTIGGSEPSCSNHFFSSDK